MVTDDLLVLPLRRARRPLSDEERRRLLIRDALSWTLVAIIHLVLFFSLVISLEQSRRRIGQRGAVETILDLTLLNRNNAPKVDLNKPDTEKDQDDFSAKPLTVIPPVPIMPPIEEAKPTPGDILGSVGRFLACGASNFERLNPAQQARCTRQPWQAVQLPNGSLVMNAVPKLIIQDTGPGTNSGAAALTRRAQTSGCPIMVNTPCLDDVISGGAGPAPGIPAPN